MVVDRSVVATLSIRPRCLRPSPNYDKEMLIRPLALLRIVVPLYAIYLLWRYVFHSQPPRTNQEAHSPPPEILIPKTVHQLLISMPEHPVSTFKPNSHSISWQQSGWKVEYWSEDACYELAQELDTLSERLYAVTFEQLPAAVLRSDFCRYLVMFSRGGIYNDLDVHLMKPLPWDVMGLSGKGEVPPSLIIGLEGDATSTGLPRSPQFVQWTIASAPSHPILHDVLDRIADRTPHSVGQAAKPAADLDIMNWTGPSVWTDAVLAYLDCTKEEIEKLRDLKTALRIKDVLVLPKRSFAVIQGEDHSSPDILVKHYFSGTWKTCRKGWMSRLIPWSC